MLRAFQNRIAGEVWGNGDLDMTYVYTHTETHKHI